MKNLVLAGALVASFAAPALGQEFPLVSSPTIMALLGAHNDDIFANIRKRRTSCEIQRAKTLLFVDKAQETGTELSAVMKKHIDQMKAGDAAATKAIAEAAALAYDLSLSTLR